MLEDDSEVLTTDALNASFLLNSSNEEMVEAIIRDGFDEMSLFPDLNDIGLPEELFSTTNTVTLHVGEEENSSEKIETKAIEKKIEKKVKTQSLNALRAKETRQKKKKEFETMKSSLEVLISENERLKEKIKLLERENLTFKCTLKYSNSFMPLMKSLEHIPGIKFSNSPRFSRITKNKHREVDLIESEDFTDKTKATNGKKEVILEPTESRNSRAKSTLEKTQNDGKPVAKNVLAARENRAKHKKFVEELKVSLNEKTEKISYLEDKVKYLFSELQKTQALMENSKAILDIVKAIENNNSKFSGSSFATNSSKKRKLKNFCEYEAKQLRLDKEVIPSLSKANEEVLCDDDSVGVCVHVSKGVVSLEFCPTCSSRESMSTSTDDFLN